MLSQGDTIAVVSKKLGVSEYTYYRWRKEYVAALNDKLGCGFLNRVSRVRVAPGVPLNF